MQKYSIALILLIFSVFSLVTLTVWDKKEINGITGDEPHYLVMASGIIKHASLEQTKPYKEEFETRAIFKPGLAPNDAEPSPTNTHAIAGPHGLFNVHNIGLPLLISIPFMLGGIIGAKIFMIFCSALVIYFGWKFSILLSKSESKIFWTITAATISLPFIPASNQIYPDILAGLIALVGLYWFFTAHKKRTKIQELLLSGVIVFLPWLQIKFAATSILLILVISAKIYLESKDAHRIISIFVISAVSFIVLAFYNYYAFGQISGPYQSGALQISKTSLMVLVGLYLDQNQGFLFQNPVNFIGILAIGWMYKSNRTFTLVWGLVFLSLIVPNALHPNWYGGYSFSGRFGWTAAVVFIIPTIYGLLKLGGSREKIFYLIISGSLLLQLYFFYHYAINGAVLYNKGSGAWFDSYSIFYYPIHSWLPMLYNSEWAFGCVPNYAWFILTCAFLFIGFMRKNIYNYASILTVFFFALILLSGLSKKSHPNEIIFLANDLPSQTGKISDSTRFATQNIDSPGFINYGPYVPLNKGGYELVIIYQSSGMTSVPIGSFDILDIISGTQIMLTPIYGTNDKKTELKFNFQIHNKKKNLMEFRTYWNGISNLTVESILLKKI